MSEQGSAQVQRLMAPIGVDFPEGHEIECEMIYERIRQARQYDEVVAEDEWACETKVADWPQVISLACEVLQDHSKHFQIACWLAEAWMKQQGLTGLSQSIELLDGLVRQWWQRGFPALAADGEPYRLAMFGRLDRDISQWLLTHSMTGAPQCSLGWWQQVLRHEHAPQGRAGNDVHATDEYSLERFRLWVTQSLDDAQLCALLEQVRHCRNLLPSFESGLSAAMDRHDAGVMPKTLEGLDAWEAFLSRMLEWVLPQGASDEAASVSRCVDDGRAVERPVQAAMTREVAISQLQGVARYFRQHEPSSPIPMLMDRAVRWANMPLQEWLLEMVRDESCLREINLVLEGPQA